MAVFLLSFLMTALTILMKPVDSIDFVDDSPRQKTSSALQLNRCSES